MAHPHPTGNWSREANVLGGWDPGLGASFQAGGWTGEEEDLEAQVSPSSGSKQTHCAAVVLKRNTQGAHLLLLLSPLTLGHN